LDEPNKYIKINLKRMASINYNQTARLPTLSYREIS